MREDLNHNDFADDVSGAKKGVDIHNEVKKKIHKMPIENIDSMGQRLLQRYINKGRFPPPKKKLRNVPACALKEKIWNLKALKVPFSLLQFFGINYLCWL